MGAAQPDRLLAIHVLEIWSFPTGVPGELDDLSDAEKERPTFMAGYYDLAGYQHVQQTRPLTLAYGLTDSPVGQLAWLNDPIMGFGRFAPPEPRDRDALLTNASIYWFTKTAGSSARWYLEDARTAAGDPDTPDPTPTGVAVLPAPECRTSRRPCPPPRLAGSGWRTLKTACAKAFVILDGTLLPIDRIAADRPFHSGDIRSTA